jgi:hypothetical protein
MEYKIQISKLWSTIKFLKKEIKMLNEKIDKLYKDNDSKVEYDEDDDFYTDEVVKRYLKPTDIKKEQSIRYVEL